MANLSSLNDDLLARVQSFLSPRARARLAATDAGQRLAAAQAQPAPQNDSYYQNAHADCFSPTQLTAADASRPSPARPGEAAETFQSAQRASYRALERLRNHSRSLGEFVREMGALQAPLSRRYAHVPAAQHGMDLWAAAAPPTAADASPPRVCAEVVAAAGAAIHQLLVDASPQAPGLAEARARLHAMPSPSLRLSATGARRCPPLAPPGSGRGRAFPPPAARAEDATGSRRTLAQAFQERLRGASQRSA